MFRRLGVHLVTALALVLVLGPPAPARAQEAPAGTPEGVLSFGRVLLEGGDSFRAATEFLRFLHHYPDHGGAPEALEGLGRAYALAGRFEEAAASFRGLLQALPEPDKEEGAWLLGSALYGLARYAEAARTLLRETDPEAPQTQAARTLGTLALLRGEHAGPLPDGARAELVDQFRALPRKSPPLAAGLSAILPGAGQVYCGRPRDGLTSLVLNGAFLWGTYEAARRDQWALAGILGFFELAWYSGNVVSAANAAHKWNRREEGRFYRRWEEDALPRWQLGVGPREVRGRLAWNW